MDKAQILELALAKLDKEYGKGTIIRLSDEVTPWPHISTGVFGLDLALGIGGLPLGRIVEIVGPESVGKSTVALCLIAAAQAEGVQCAYIDAENALDPGYMKVLGVNLGDLLLSQPDNGEQGLEIVDTLVKTGSVGVIIIDSVAALVPKAELEGDMDQQQMGLQARLMSKALRKLSHPVAENKVLLVFINQLRSSIGPYATDTTPGGRALKYYASVRIDLRRVGEVKATDGIVTGVRVKAKVAKNKMAPALRICEFDIIYGHGPDNLGTLIDLADERGIITRKGAWYYYGETQFAHGKEKAIAYLASDLDFADKLKGKILEYN